MDLVAIAIMVGMHIWSILKACYLDFNSIILIYTVSASESRETCTHSYHTYISSILLRQTPNQELRLAKCITIDTLNHKVAADYDEINSRGRTHSYTFNTKQAGNVKS